jgi:hypothetical protein
MVIEKTKFQIWKEMQNAFDYRNTERIENHMKEVYVLQEVQVPSTPSEVKTQVETKVPITPQVPVETKVKIKKKVGIVEECSDLLKRLKKL